MYSKPTFLLYGLLLCAPPVYSQYFTHIEQTEFYNRIADLRPEGDSVLWLCTFSNQNTTQRLLRVQADGHTSTTLVQAFGQTMDYDFMPFGSGVLATNFFSPCDLLVARQLAFYDANGELLWSRDIAPPSAEAVPTKLLPGPGQTFWLFRQDSVPLQYDALGEVFEAGPFPLPVFRGYQPTADGKLLTYGPAGLALYSPQLNFMQFGLQNRSLVKAIPLPDGRVCAISKDSLFLVDADFTLLFREKGLPQVDSMVDLSVFGNELRVLARKGTAVQMGWYDLDLHFVELSSPAPNMPFRPHLIHQDANRLVLAGEELAEPAHRAQVICLKSGLDASFDPGATDVALTDVLLPKKPVVQHMGAWGGYTVTLDSASVVIENKGSSVLESVHINALLDAFSFWCFLEEPHYFMSFDNLHLTPGESATLPLGRLLWGNPGNVHPPELNFCFWTSMPNDSLDAWHNNNQSCRTIGLVLSAPTPGEAALPIRISPNPVQAGTAVLEWPGEPFAPAQIRVYDARGRLLQEAQTTGTSWVFQRSEWPAGLYPVQVLTKGGRLFAGKIMVE